MKAATAAAVDIYLQNWHFAKISGMTSKGSGAPDTVTSKKQKMMHLGDFRSACLTLTTGDILTLREVLSLHQRLPLGGCTSFSLTLLAAVAIKKGVSATFQSEQNPY